MPAMLDTARAEALFASTLQPSDHAAADEVRTAVTTSIRRLRLKGCVAQVATEFGDHPDDAVRRMAWALATVRTVYQPRTDTTRRTAFGRRFASAS